MIASAQHHSSSRANDPAAGVPSILCIGVNHRLAAVETRERLAFPRQRMVATLREMHDERSDARSCVATAGLVLLATCNRSEIYLSTSDPAAAQQAMLAFLASYAGFHRDELLAILEIRQGSAAVEHLLRVAAGLDSLVIGESEILGQIKEAYSLAQEAGVSGPILGALFRGAIQAGKRVRAEAGIGQAQISVATVVVELAEEMLGSLQGRTALLVGAGKISSLTACALANAGLACILVANRTFDRAEQLARRIDERARRDAQGRRRDAQGRAVHFDALPECLQAADIVICSTGAPHVVLHTETIAEAMSRRAYRPLLVADLAMPRDVAPDAAKLPGVRLVNIDDLDHQVQTRHLPSSTVCQQAAAILAQELDCFQHWLAERRNAALVGALQQKADAICQAQVQKTLRRNPDFSPEQQEAITALARAIAGQLIRDPIQAIKLPPAGMSSEQIEAFTQALFQLN